MVVLTGSLFFVPLIVFGQSGSNCSVSTQPLLGGLVPCSGNGCGTCEIVALAQRITTFVIGIATAIAVIMFVWAGFLIMSAGGNAAQAKRGRGVMTDALIGLIIILSAWLIIDLFLKSLLPGGTVAFNSGPMPWNQVTCSTQRQVCDASVLTPGNSPWQNSPNSGSPGSGGTTGTTPPNTSGSGGSTQPNASPTTGTGGTTGGTTGGGSGSSGGGTSGSGSGTSVVLNPNTTYTVNDPGAGNHGQPINLTGQVTSGGFVAFVAANGSTYQMHCSLLSPVPAGCP